MPKQPELRRSAARRALLADRLGRGPGRTANALAARPPRVAPPLSPAQERFWFREQLEPENPAYQRPLLLELVGTLQHAALEQALNALIERHETLRMAILTVQGRPVLHLRDTCRVEIPLIDLEHVPEGRRDSEIRKHAFELIRHPVTLDAPSMLRTVLLRRDAERYVLVLGMHHVICDGWSVGILAKDLAAFYEGMLSESPSTPPPLAVQYSDFAHWQRRQLESDRLQEQLEYWKQQLQDSPHSVSLPLDHARGLERSYRGATRSVRFAPELTGLIRQLAQSKGATPFMLMAAAFTVLLHRYSGQTDIVLGSPTAGRTRAEIEPLVGFFVNLLVLRCDVSGNPTFSSLLDRVRNVCLDAYANQEVPFERVLESLRVKRQHNESPLFNVMFELEPPAFGAIDAGGVRIEELEFDDGTALFDLSIELHETTSGIRVKCVYNRDLFDAATVDRLLLHYETLVAAACSQPDSCIWRMPLVTAAERQQLVVDWNRTARPEFGKACVHQLVEEQVRKYPDQPAVWSEDELLSYAELDRRANRLAHHLRSLGVAPGSCTALCLDRSAELIVAVLAVLKAGGSYVPVDPAYPLARRQYMLADSGAQILVTRHSLLGGLPPTACRLVCLERDAATIAQAAGGPLGTVSAPSDLAMVIYTSGSTGRPKGVMIEHHSLVNYCQACGEHLALQSDDRLLQFSSISFDASAEEIFATLISGATLVLRNERMIGDPMEFLSTCERWGVSVLAMPTAYWHELVRGLHDHAARWPASVRLCAIGGEQAGAASLSQWLQRVGRDVRLVNGYGPTETTIVSTFCDLDKLAPEQCEPVVPIGGPVANTAIYLLDREQQPVPIGVLGELYIGGEGVGRGYLNRPDLTEAAFIDDPFSRVPGARLYRTGDLGRRRADGLIELAGRLDQQVKVRGFRIEPGEIEHALDRHPAVARSLIMPVRAGDGDADAASLVAYVVAWEGGVETKVLRDHLSGLLPTYLLPSAFVIMDAFPLTPNGKVDTAALPIPQAADPSGNANVALPVTPTEQVVAEIWAEVLKLNQVGVDENFFELGGDSIRATQIVARLMDRAGIRIDLGAVFEAPTVAKLAAHIDERGAAAPP